MSNEKLNFTDAQILRMKAEDQLKDKQKKSGVSEMENDIKKLVHELQVHQIELEMQNEELKIAHEKAYNAIEKYTELYDYAEWKRKETT